MENAQATSPVTLAPGATWAASTAFKVRRWGRLALSDAHAQMHGRASCVQLVCIAPPAKPRCLLLSTASARPAPACHGAVLPDLTWPGLALLASPPSCALQASRDPLLDFCADNPDSEECRVYDD